MLLARILLVDDDEDLPTVHHILARNGFEVITTSVLKEGIKKKTKSQALVPDKKLLNLLHSKNDLKPTYRSLMLFVGCAVLLGLSIFFISNSYFASTVDPLKTKYLIENLRGDIVVTWKNWRLVPGEPLTVNIINNAELSETKIKALKDAILSMQTISIDNSESYDAKGTFSTYYVGWIGALKEASKFQTLYVIPTEIELVQLNKNQGNIIINLVSSKDSDGYNGFTKSLVDGNEILKSYITIYDADEISLRQLQAIVRHEFGHALGLGHSSAADDLMYATLKTNVPFISGCNISALVELYNGKVMNEVICEI